MNGKENTNPGIWHNLEFAEVCAFYRQFHKKLEIVEPNFKDLHDWLTHYGEVPDGLASLHLVLLNLIRKKVKGHKTKTCKSWEIRLRMYCISRLPMLIKAAWRKNYAEVDVAARLSILRHLQLNVLTRCLDDYPDELRDQYVGTDCFGKRYVMKLWPEPNRKCWISFDLHSNMLDSRRRWIYRSDVEQLITYLERDFRHCTSIEQTFEHQQMISFLTILQNHFPILL